MKNKTLELTKEEIRRLEFIIWDYIRVKMTFEHMKVEDILGLSSIMVKINEKKEKSKM